MKKPIKTKDEVEAQLRMIEWILKQKDIQQAVTEAREKLLAWKKKTTVEKDPEYPDQNFCLFWSAYPKKVGKGATYKAWKKLKPSKELTERILSSVEVHKQGDKWKKDNGDYIPNPATWLNQKRYDDEVSIKGKTTAEVRSVLNVEYEIDDITRTVKQVLAK